MRENKRIQFEIAKVAKNRRKRRKMTQEELGLRTGLSKQFYYNFESGKSVIPIDNLKRVIHFLGIQRKSKEIIERVNSEEVKSLLKVEK